MVEENFNLDTLQSSETHFLDKHNSSFQPVENCFIRDTANKPQEEINSMKKDSILHILSKIYAQLLVTVAVIAVFTEILHGPVPLFYIHVYIYLYLLSVSILIFVWSFINRHIFSKENKCCEIWENHPIQTKYFEFGLFVCGLAIFICTCLKSAAAVTSEACISLGSSTMYVVTSIFIILQLYFFCSKNSGYIAHYFQNFALMHLAATNAALWLYMVLWDSAIDWQDALHLKHNSSLNWSKKDLNITVHTLESDFRSLNQSHHFPKHVVHFTSNCWWHIVPESELPVDIISVHLCLQNSTVGVIWKKTSEYLYPLAVQYYLIALFLLYIMHKSLSLKLEKYSVTLKFQKIGHCFCVSKGFYLGCIYFIVSILVVVLYFISNIENIDIVVMSMLSIIYASAIFAILAGLCQMKFVDTAGSSLNQISVNCYHETGVYFVFAYGTFNLFVGSLSHEKYINLLLITEALLMILHAISQYIFIRLEIKSRQAINFLILCNVSLWILESFVFYYKGPTDLQSKVYNIAWPVISRIIIPCLAFYRFNSVLLLSNISKYISAEYH